MPSTNRQNSLPHPAASVDLPGGSSATGGDEALLSNLDGDAADAGCSGLPPIVSGADFTAQQHTEPAQVISGVLHRGSKGIYAGPSKACKTWVLLDLAFAVAAGDSWLDFPTAQGRVLYINFELQPFALHKRLHAIAGARDTCVPADLHIWNLRGHARPLCELVPHILRHAKDEGYSLIVPDPIYKTLAGRNENDAGDIGELCLELDDLAVQTGAAIFFGHHFAKGNAAGKNHIDRASGSGVWARDPDAILTATENEAEGCFSIEMTLRNFAPVDPFAVRWNHPRMTRDNAVDPLRLKKQGRNEAYPVEMIMGCLSGAMSTMQWFKVCAGENGISKPTFLRRVKDAERSGLIEKDGQSWKHRELPGYPGEKDI
jgi:hypothetical protein